MARNMLRTGERSLAYRALVIASHYHTGGGRAGEEGGGYDTTARRNGDWRTNLGSWGYLGKPAYHHYIIHITRQVTGPRLLCD